MVLSHGTPKLVLKPYAHAWMTGWLDEDFYRELKRCRPNTRPRLEAGQNERCDISAAMMLNTKENLPPVWREFVEYCTSHEFWLWLRDLFGDVIRTKYPQLDIDNWTTCIRGVSKRSDACLECQLSINTVPTVTSTVRGPHVDSTKQLIGGMLYMPTAGEGTELGGDLLIYEYTSKPQVWGKSEIKPCCVREVARIPYEPNTLMLFLNSMDAVHGVGIRERGSPERHMVNLCVEQGTKLFDEQLFRVEDQAPFTTTWGLTAEEFRAYG